MLFAFQNSENKSKVYIQNFYQKFGGIINFSFTKKNKYCKNRLDVNIQGIENKLKQYSFKNNIHKT